MFEFIVIRIIRFYPFSKSVFFIMASKRKQTTWFKCNFKKKVSQRGTVIELSDKEFIEGSSQEKGFYKCNGFEDSFKSKARALHTRVLV